MPNQANRNAKVPEGSAGPQFKNVSASRATPVKWRAQRTVFRWRMRLWWPQRGFGFPVLAGLLLPLRPAATVPAAAPPCANCGRLVGSGWTWGWHGAWGSAR